LRTPLTIISGYLETLADGGLDDRPMAENALGVMFKHADRLGRLVDDLLTISRAESRSVPLEVQRIDLHDLLRRVVEQFDEPIRSQAATVRITAADGDLTLEADAVRLEQVFLNLLENALKYGNRPGLTIDLYVERGGPNIHVQVTDNGPGIPREDQEHVFERFYRVHKDRSRETGGTGLGLSIVKNVVQAHGGNVSVRSAPGEGSTFVVVLPLLQSAPLAPAPWSAAKKTATNGTPEG
jgi:two-component system phosphate regulon sensor histidine kinase PhoR